MENINTVQRGYLKEIGRWGKFLGIVMAVATAFMFLLAVVMLFAGDSDVLQGVPAWVLSLIYLLCGALYLVMTILVLKASNRLKHADTADEDTLTEGLRYSRNFFRFVGILTIVMLGALVLCIPVGIIVGLMMAL